MQRTQTAGRLLLKGYRRARPQWNNARLQSSINDNPTTFDQVQFLKNEQPKGPQDPKLKAILDTPVGKLGAKRYGSKFALRSIIHLAQLQNNFIAVDMADRLLQRLAAEGAEIETRTYNIVLRGWAGLASIEESAFSRCHALLVDMMERSLPPNLSSYWALLNACAHTSNENARSIADSIVESLIQEAEGQLPLQLFDSIIQVHARRADREYGAAAAAEDWLMKQTKMAAEGVAPPPSTKSFNLVLIGWSLSSEEKGADRCQELMEMMMHMEYKHQLVRLDDVTFGTVAAAYARRIQPYKALEIFSRGLEYCYQRSRIETDKPVNLTACLNACMDAIAKSGLPEANEMADNLILDAYALRASSSTQRPHLTKFKHAVEIIPDLVTHTSYLDVQVRSGCHQKAHEHLLDMVEASDAPSPTTTTFHMVLRAWLRDKESSERGERAKQLLDVMIQQSAEHGQPCAPNESTFAMCIKIQTEGHRRNYFAMQLWQEANFRGLASFETTASLLTALATKSAGIRDTERAITVLSEAKLPLTSPKNRGLYTAVLSSAMRHKHDDHHAALVQQLWQQPEGYMTSAAYTSLLLLFTRRGNAGDISAQVFEVVRRLDADSSCGVKIDLTLFQAIFQGLQSSGRTKDADETCRVLIYMMRDKKMVLNRKCWDACLTTLMQCKSEPHAATARALMKRTTKGSDPSPHVKALVLKSDI